MEDINMIAYDKYYNELRLYDNVIQLDCHGSITIQQVLDINRYLHLKTTLDQHYRHGSMLVKYEGRTP
jgi:hypothetical protein